MMETNQMTKKILDFQKDVITQWYDVVTSMQEQTAESLKSVLAQSNWMPHEGRRMVRNWVDACQKGCDEYKELLEDSFSGLQKVLVIPSNKAVAVKKTTKKRAPKKAKTKAAAKVEAASTADKSEDIVPTTASPKAAAMEDSSASVTDKDKTAK